MTQRQNTVGLLSFIFSECSSSSLASSSSSRWPAPSQSTPSSSPSLPSSSSSPWLTCSKAENPSCYLKNCKALGIPARTCSVAGAGRPTDHVLFQEVGLPSSIMLWAQRTQFCSTQCSTNSTFLLPLQLMQLCKFLPFFAFII